MQRQREDPANFNHLKIIIIIITLSYEHVMFVPFQVSSNLVFLYPLHSPAGRYKCPPSPSNGEGNREMEK